MDEKEGMVRSARAWNFSSPDWSWNNQCADQAAALAAHLNTLKPKYWSVSVLGGYSGVKTSISGINIGLVFQHHIVEVDPLRQPGEKKDCRKPFTIDEFKVPGQVESFITIGTVDDFKAKYPNYMP